MKKNTVPKGIKIKMSREEIAYQIFIAVVVGLLVLCCLIPFLYVVGMSFTSEGEMIQRNFFVIVPQKPILAAYEYLLKNKDFFSGMGITIIRGNGRLHCIDSDSSSRIYPGNWRSSF